MWADCTMRTAIVAVKLLGLGLGLGLGLEFEGLST